MTPTLPRRFYGVDFSGAEDAGRKIWITRGEATPKGLAIEQCLPAEALPGGGIAREPALLALRGLNPIADENGDWYFWGPFCGYLSSCLC